MRAYWQAVTQLSGAAVDAAIYSTTLGQLISYERDELIAEWERLQSLSDLDFARELPDDNQSR